MRRDLARLQQENAQEKQENQDRVDGLDRRIKEAGETIREMDARQKALDERTSRTKADFGAEVNQLLAEVATLKGGLETKEYQLRERELQLGASQQSVKDLENRVAELERRLKEVETMRAAAPVPATPPPAPVPETPKKPGLPTERQALYDFGKKAFDDGDYALGREAFDKFIKAYPKDKDLLDNTYFWSGECHYQQKAYDKAILSYQKVISEFPKSEKADAALLKMGQSFAALGFDDDAKVFFDELLQKHPKSPLVKDAKAKLDEIARKKKAAPPKPAPAKPVPKKR